MLYSVLSNNFSYKILKNRCCFFKLCCRELWRTSHYVTKSKRRPSSSRFFWSWFFREVKSKCRGGGLRYSLKRQVQLPPSCPKTPGRIWDAARCTRDHVEGRAESRRLKDPEFLEGLETQPDVSKTSSKTLPFRKHSPCQLSGWQSGRGGIMLRLRRLKSSRGINRRWSGDRGDNVNKRMSRQGDGATTNLKTGDWAWSLSKSVVIAQLRRLFNYFTNY